jgi:DNA repair exonuclease SbcCD ATPase subunit
LKQQDAACSAKLRDLDNSLAAMRRDLAALEEQVRAKREAIDAALARIAKGQEVLAGLAEERVAAEEAVAKHPDPTPRISVLKGQLAAVGQTNDKLTKRRLAADQLARLAAENEQAEAEHQRLETILAQLRHLRVHLLDGVDLGVPGLEVGQGELRLDGVSFRQASRAQRLRTAVAVAALQNPKLRVLRVDDAEHLDSEGVRLLYEIAEQRDFQVIMARVQDGPESKVEFVEGAA